MAGNQTITVDFNANLVRFTSSIDKATADLNKFQSNASRIAGQIKGAFGGLAAGLSVGALGSFVKSTIDAADAMNDLSKKTGVAVEQLAGFDLAARSSGTSLEDIGGAMGKLNKTMGEAAGGNKEAAAMLEALGVTAKKPEEALYQLADAFGRMGSEGDKARAFSAVLGKSWQNLAPLLSEGGDGLRALVEEGKRLNPITKEMAENSDKFNDSLERFKVQAGGVGTTIANSLLPSLNALLEKLNQGASMSSKFGFLSLLAKGINPTGDAGRELQTIRKEIEATEKALNGYKPGTIFHEDTKKKLAELKRIKAAYEEVQSAEALANNDKFGTGAYKQAKAPALPDIKLPKLGKDAAAAKTKADKLDLIDPFAKERAAAEADALRKTVEQQNAAYDAMASVREYQIEQEEQAAAALGRTRDAMLDLIDPIQRFRDELDKVDELVLAGLFTPEQAAAARLYWNEQMDAAAGFGKVLRDDAEKSADIAKELGMTFSSAFEDAIVAGKEFSDILDGIAQDITRIFIRKAVTEPIAAGLGDIFKGFDLGAIFGGGKAVGGPVSSGRAYLVGERGPELFVPPASGNIVPNNQLGGGRAVVINMNVSAQDAGSFRKSMGQIKADLAFAVNSAGRNL